VESSARVKMEWESAAQFGVGAHGGASREKLRSLLRGRTLAVVGMVAMLGMGCNNDFFRIGSATDSNLERTFTPSRIATTGAGPKYLGEISGDPGRVSYRTDSEKRMFLLDSTLEGERAVSGGIEALYPLARDVILLPASNGATQEFWVNELDPTKTWRSARVYDIGMCSSFTSLDNPLGSLVEGIPREIFEAIETDRDSSGAVLHRWQVEPILRMVPGPIDGTTGVMRKDADALIVDMSVRANRFGGGIRNFFIDCDDGRLVPGARWECNFALPTDDEGTCKVVVEADRVHFRPDELTTGLLGRLGGRHRGRRGGERERHPGLVAPLPALG
jgi:hypothetical protein